MRNMNILCILFILGVVRSESEEDVQKFLEDFQKTSKSDCLMLKPIEWRFAVDRSSENRETMMENIKILEERWSNAANKASSFNLESISDPWLRKQLENILHLKKIPLSPTKSEIKSELLKEISTAVNTNKICRYTTDDTCDLIGLEEIESIGKNSNNFEELLYYWKNWRESFGKSLKNSSIEILKYANEESRLNGFSDRKEYESFMLSMDNLEEVLDKIWTEIQPLYQQFHAYIRRKFIEEYGSDKIRNDGPIPIHLFGPTRKVMLNKWNKLELPFPNKPLLDVTSIIQNMESREMVKKAEEFFVSMGFEPWNENFWTNSSFEKQSDCWITSFEFCLENDFRIVTCGDLTIDAFNQIHTEMGRLYMMKENINLPMLFRYETGFNLFNPIKNAIELSINTITHWKQIGFVHEGEDNEENVNFLFDMVQKLLSKMTYMLNKWKFAIYDGTIRFDEMNKKWWEMRHNFEGQCPYQTIDENHLDIISWYFKGLDASFAREFLEQILQFQIYKALCDVAGHTGPLYKCDISGSHEAGNLLKEIYNLGSSKSWHEMLKIITRNNSATIDAGPFMEYFQPVYEWLKNKNVNEIIGWSSDDATTCI